jgi:Cu/Ag efflux protein CusF
LEVVRKGNEPIVKRLLAAPLALVLSVSAFAHNGMEHIMGTVTAITATSIDVKNPKDGKVTPVVTDAKTMWMRGKDMITAKDVHTGDRVAIHAKKVDGKFLAAEVEMGTATAAGHSH